VVVFPRTGKGREVRGGPRRPSFQPSTSCFGLPGRLVPCRRHPGAFSSPWSAGTSVKSFQLFTLKTGEKQRGRPGVMAGIAPAISARFHIGFSRGVPMYSSNQKRYYSPPFSEVSAVSVRRLAWALGLSMPRAVDHVVGLLPSLFPSGVVCLSCKDNTKCQSCAFSQQSAAASTVPAV
jgi:hypothetical protein